MGKNSKPILSVLVDEDKKEKFADIARRHKYSMGWLVNNCIDRMIEADSIDIYRDSVGDMSITPKLGNAGLSAIDIEEIVKSYVSTHLKTSSIGVEDVEQLIRTSIEPINESVTELEAYTQGQFIAVREELKKALSFGVTPDAIAKPVQVEMNSPAAKLLPTGEVNDDYVNRLTELVGTGLSVTEIAQKLTDEGFTNSKGEGLNRKSIESKLRMDENLKSVYDNARSKS
jgi:hypothetical protein